MKIRGYAVARAVFSVILLAIPAFPFENNLNDLSSGSCENCEHSVMLCDDLVRTAMLRCWEQSMNGRSEYEFGFSLSKYESGYFIVYSKSDNFFRKAKIHVPNESIALFHTHPNSVSPEPSAKDRQTARELDKPVCTITRRGIYCYYPNRDETVKLRGFLEWTKPC